MSRRGNGDCRILPAAMVAAVAMLAASLPALAQREDAPQIERYDFEDLGIDLPGVISEPIDSLISVFEEDEETPTAEEEALAAEREALAAEKAALEAEKAALAAEKAALAAEEEALAAERDALAAEKEALTAAEEAPAVAEQAPAEAGVRIEISTAEEDPQAGEQAPPPQETDFVRDLYAAWADRDALARALQWVRTVADIDMPLDQHGNTALHYAAPARLDVLRALVARGADCNARNGYGASPLHIAAAQRGPHGQTSGPGAVALLVQCGADPDLRDNLRVTPLHAVYTSVELGLASRFLNTIVLARVPYDSRERWRDAYEAGGHVSGGSGGKSTQVLRALLEAGAGPDGRDVNGATPLMMAVKTQAFASGEHIPLLLKHEADADARDIAGRTAAMHAIFSWDSAHGDDYGVEAIGALLAGGADPDVQDEEGATALIHAVRKESFGRRDNGGALREVELLLAGGADPCIADRGGRLPWDYAREGSLERDLLREAGGMPRRESFEITDFDGSTYDALGAEEGCDTEARMAETALGLDREARERVQACLVARGFAAGAPDGVFGARTRSALLAWQRERGEGEATGYLTQEGMAALLASCAPGPRPRCAGGEGEPACWMEAENRPGCYLWNPNPQPEETVAWSGACVEGKASGRGKTAWRFREDGAWKTSGQTGEYREGRAAADGHWLYHYSDGQTWEGPLRRGRSHGLWVRRGSGGLERDCVKSGERVDERSCVHAVDRAMQTLRPAAVRSGPGEDYEKLATLPAGQRVKVTGSARGGWRQVEMEGESLGFVRAALLEKAVAVAQWRAGEVFRDCADCPEMVVVPAGSFTMGSPSSEEGRDDDEGPQHRVTISRPFAVGVYEVTFAQWDACAAAGGCGGYRPEDDGWGRGRRPVIHVSWEDARAYLRWLSGKAGAEYRLLSEAEWEYAARAGTSTAWHTGGTISSGEANFGGNHGGTVPVGSFAANGFGLHDVHGNVLEWVGDCWNGSYAGAPGDGSAWESGDCEVRVVRGGSWISNPRHLRSASRNWFDTGDRISLKFGFRAARTLAP